MPVFTSIGIALGVSASMWGGLAALGTGLAATAAVGAAGWGAAALMSGGSKDSKQLENQMPQGPTAPTQDDAAAKASLIQDEKRKNMARSTSVKTNPLGLKEEATVVRKKLLGG